MTCARHLGRALATLCVAAISADARAQQGPAPRCGTGVHESEALGTVLFPADRLDCPVLADPKEPRTFVSVLRGRFRSLDAPDGDSTTIGTVGLGDSFGLIRWGGPVANDGLQLDAVGSIFAQFDLGAESYDLINADYVIGLPLTFRRGGFSTRLKVYPRARTSATSTLLRTDEIDRENLSFESVAALVSQEIGPLRLYAGAERLFRREPAGLPSKLFQAGVELRSARSGAAQLVSGVDVKTTERHDWSPAISGRLGFEVARHGTGGHPARRIGLLLEAYTGPSPTGSSSSTTSRTSASACTSGCDRRGTCLGYGSPAPAPRRRTPPCGNRPRCRSARAHS